MPDATTVTIKPAKGRPMLTWVGKRPLHRVTAYPAQLVEVFDPQPPAHSAGEGNLLFHGDNKDVLAYLLADGYRGKVNMIYIDPPFDSGADYVRAVSLRGVTGATKVEGESYTLGEQIQYTDIWTNDNYLQYMYERLLLLKELLADDGSIYLHCDYHKNHLLRCVLDEVFGPGNLIAELAWQRSDSHNDATYYGIVHDTLLAYSKSGTPKFNKIFLPISRRTADNWYRHVEPETGRRYNLGNLVSPHPRPNLMYEWRGIKPPAMGWRISKERMAELDSQGLLVVVGNGNPTLKVKQYLDDSKGRLLSTWWDDISQIRGYGSTDEKTDYPTQKPEDLMERILEVSSNPGDLVLDCFIGSGTTAAVAQKLGRRWIGADINKGAIQTTAKRLQAIIQEQLAASRQLELPTADSPSEIVTTQPSLRGTKQSPSIGPEIASQKALAMTQAEQLPEFSHQKSAMSFAVYRVNDYDLQIQHNEAVNLACEYLGITRTKTDAYFDGVRGKELVKIVPFNHPLSPVDLEDVKRELAARPDEGRDVLIVALGQERGVDGWLENWNRLRKRGDFPNKVHVIELRTDATYGKFFAHQPAKAKVSIKRARDKIQIEIEDFVSPTIIERLKQQSGVVTAHIDDWRAMVDSVMIDTAYDGAVFNITLADVPEKKSDLVAGSYELDAPDGETNVAVKITDMLGEEVIETKRV